MSPSFDENKAATLTEHVTLASTAGQPTLNNDSANMSSHVPGHNGPRSISYTFRVLFARLQVIVSELHSL